MTLTQFNEQIEKVQIATSQDDLHRVCADICELCGFDQYIYGALLPDSFVNPQLITINGYDEAWWDRYVSQEYLRIDPVVNHCLYRHVPINWGDLNKDTLDNEQSKQLMEEARDFGLVNGVSIPLHSYEGEMAIMSFASGESGQATRDRIDHYTPQLMLLSFHLHEAMKRLLAQDMNIPKLKAALTKREKECLLWAAEGKTTWETSQILNISERTVRFHMENVATKLKASSRQHSVAKAVHLGLIRQLP